MTPKISMLLPARGRPANLRSSIASVFDLASHPDDVEFIVRLDNCDPHSREEIAIIRDLPRTDNVNIGVDSRLGYSRMHEYYNWTASVAQGDWLFMWNDDIEMVTKGWDDLIREAPPFSVQFPRRDTTKTSDYTLPVVGRPVYEAMGHLSLNAYCDAWLSDISAFAGTSVLRDDVEFVHHRLNDATLREQADGGQEWHKFTAEQQRAMRLADKERVVCAPGWAARHDGWNVEEQLHVGIDYINLCAGEARARSYVLHGRK